MLVPVFLSFIWCANAYTPRCTDKGDTPMTFRPTEDGVVGRYRAELCTRRNPNVTEWQIDLLYYDTPQYCSSNWTAARRRRPGHEHSVDTLQIEDPNNCTHVCYLMDLDLIFSSCYLIKSTMITGDIKMPPNDTFHMITSKLTIESINGNKPFVNFVNHNDDVTLIWYLGIPPTDCKVTLCQTKNVTGEDLPNACEGDLLDVTSNCTRDELHNELRCVFAPPYGGYRALVQHGAPWTTGVFIKQQYTRYEFMHAPVSAPTVATQPARAGGAAAAWWACGGALALAAAALGAVAARRELHRCAYYKHILRGRRPPRQESEPPPPSPPPGEEGERPVLLLYAREGERGQRVVDRLVELLQQAIAAPVWDVHGARVAALSARAPHEWVRGALAARGVRVLLLQTPALAALYRAHMDADTHSGFKLAEPLLGRRVLYRAPQFADALLQYALRLLAGDAPAHHAYHKYYLATLTELSTDIFPQVVPFTRYPLPHAAAALLRDLAPPSPSPSPSPASPAPAPLLLQQLEEAVEQFVSHATENPNYLMEELLVIANN